MFGFNRKYDSLNEKVDDLDVRVRQLENWRRVLKTLEVTGNPNDPVNQSILKRLRASRGKFYKQLGRGLWIALSDNEVLERIEAMKRYMKEKKL